MEFTVFIELFYALKPKAVEIRLNSLVRTAKKTHLFYHRDKLVNAV